MMRHCRMVVWLGCVLGTLAFAGCADLSYYLRSMHGHFSLLHAAKPIQDLLNDPSTPPALKTRLTALRDIRQFASEELALPDNESYRRYADLGRPFAVWNVFATPELSMRLKQWCFPVVGCVAYRGYYDMSDAEALAEPLRQTGWDVNVGGVPAYSSLGYFNDPVLNTFIGYPQGELARLVFHELTHQIAFAKGDTAFNESFATAVEEYGVERWLSRPENTRLRGPYEQFVARRGDFIALLSRFRRLLEANYARPVSDEDKRQRKAELFAQLKAEYVVLKTERWGGFSGYDRWFAQPLNNAHLAAVATYVEWLPAFRNLLQSHQYDLPRFYATVKKMADMDHAARQHMLRTHQAAAQNPSRTTTEPAAISH